jgi:16S rRNA (adenine1518-N6/adenine1519-N6)-dimethyltransferase
MTVDEIKGILKVYGIRPWKGAGQSFLIDENIAEKIVDSADVESETVVEIGPGLGILTRRLVERARLVVGIELDRNMCQFLSAQFEDARNFVLINADFLELNLEDLSEYGDRFRIISNLPYSISKPAIARITGLSDFIDTAVVTVQEEVADRITASPGKHGYGILSVMVAYRARAEALFRIGNHSFYPSPKVNSTTIKLTMLEEPAFKALDEKLFEAVVKGAFSQRRKMLRNALAPYLELDAEKLALLEKESGIDFKRRGETLSVREFVHLANTLATKLQIDD